MTTGETIMLLREKAELTQKELGEKLEINRSVINRIEQGTRPIRDDELKKIANFFNVSTDYLLGRPRLATFKNEDGTVDVYEEVPSYYKDPEVARIAQEMHDDPGRRVLFDASRGLSKESIEEVRKFIEFQKAKEGGL